MFYFKYGHGRWYLDMSKYANYDFRFSKVEIKLLTKYLEGK